MSECSLHPHRCEFYLTFSPLSAVVCPEYPYYRLSTHAGAMMGLTHTTRGHCTGTIHRWGYRGRGKGGGNRINELDL